MAMKFTPVPVASGSGGSGRVGVTPEVESDVKEAWDWFQANPGYHLFTDEFQDETAQNAWVRQAKAHADTLGLRLRIVRDDALKDQVILTGKPKVRFHIETQEAYEARQAEKERKAAELAAKKAAGEVVKPGRKPKGQ